MIWLAKHWKALAALVLAACLWGHGYHAARTAGLLALQMERNKAEQMIADMAQAEAKAQADARKAERAGQAAVDAVAAKYEQEKTDAQAAADRLVADLRAGNKRLHDRWQASIATSRLSSDAQAARLADEAERDRQGSAARIIAAADRCDAQVKGLQDYARTVSH